MKLIYSHLKRFLPSLNEPIEKIGNDLSLIGHMSEGIENISGEKVISLEIRQNRGDCFGYYGLAKELAVLYDLNLKTPKIKLPQAKEKTSVPIDISAEKEVDRIMSVKINNLKNQPSPAWLKKFLAIHDINPINTLVDLTNYIMLVYGIPCHAFDADKISGGLVWEITDKTDKIITLDGTKIDIPENSFVISDDKGAASLPAIGGKRTAIDLDTQKTIIEMAVYNPEKVRLDAKQMNIQTDAKIRLEKGLDPNLISLAFKHLIQLVLKECGGEIITKVKDYYPDPKEPAKIKLNISNASAYAGIKIPDEFGLQTLKKLGCKIKKNKKEYLVSPPTLRKDLSLEEDLIEEIIRFYGYDKISTDRPISSKELGDITPKVIYLKQTIKNILANMGYDEIRSWPIIQEKNIHQSPAIPKNAAPVYTQNNVNSNYPLLRMSLASSLYLQTKQYSKYKLPDLKFFEIGKIYYKHKNNYQEPYSAGFYQPDQEKLINDAENLFKKLGINQADYQIEEIKNKKFIEINLNKIVNKLETIPEIKLVKPKKQTQQAIELTKQIINLDANVILNQKLEPEKLLKKYLNKIENKYLWKLSIVDIYKTKANQYKYTFRAYYYNLSAKKAKEIHLKTFQLE